MSLPGVLLGKKPAAGAPPSGFFKYTTFNGSTDSVTFNMGGLASVASAPQTLVVVVRKVSGGSDAEIVACPSFDPLDFFYINGGTTIAFSDGPGFVNGPTFINSQWCLYAFRTLSGANTKWSKSVYSGSSWPTPTHTSGGVTLSSRTYPASGVITFGNAAGMVFDIVCFARFNTDLSDAQINAMTAGVTAIQGTANITTLWEFGDSSPSDLVGTSTLNTKTGTTLSATDSPFAS